MKLTQFNTKIFVSELADLSDKIDQVTHQAETWLNGQEARSKGQTFDQYRMQSIRLGLENQLNELREKLALVYDFQGDRGMADFAPAGFNNGDSKEEEEEEDYWIDLLFPDGKEKTMGTAMLKYDPRFWSKLYDPMIASGS